MGGDNLALFVLLLLLVSTLCINEGSTIVSASLASALKLFFVGRDEFGAGVEVVLVIGEDVVHL